MIVNREAIQAVFVNIKTTFMKAFDGAPSDYEDTCTRVPSTGKENSYKWMNRFPKMREWIGSKQYDKLKAFTYTIVNRKFEATVEVEKDDIEDDNLGTVSMQAQDAGYSGKQWPDELSSELKNNAFTNTCYDGQYFYDTDHPVGNTTASNKGTAPLSWATLEAAQASYGAARASIMSRVDDEGRPLGIIPNVLEVPSALEEAGRMLLTSDELADKTKNPYKGTATLKVNPRLTSSTAWFLHCTTRPVKPFVVQIRKDPTFVSQTSLESDDAFDRGIFKFGAEARGNAGYALWQLSYGSTGEG